MKKLLNNKNGKWHTVSTDNLQQRQRHFLSLTGFTPSEINNSLNKSDGNVTKTVKRKKRFLSLTGFTFIELMLIVTLIGVIFMLNAPRVRNTFENFRLENTSRKISSLIRFAQSKAITTNQNIYLLYKQEKQRFHLAKEEAISGEERKIELEKRYSMNITEEIQVGFDPTISSENIVLIFDSDGSIEGPSIILTTNNISLRIVARGTIGSVQVERISE